MAKPSSTASSTPTLTSRATSLLVCFLFGAALLASSAHAEFNFETAKCLMSILVEGVRKIPDSAETRQDSYVQNLRKILDGDARAAFEQFSDVRLVLDLNQLLISYASLSGQIQADIKACNLKLNGPMQRCVEKYGEGQCQQIWPVAVGPVCGPNQRSYHNFYCYDLCPAGFPEDPTVPANKCRKPKVLARKAYSSLTECEKARDADCANASAQNARSECGLSCDSYIQESFWTRACPPNFTKTFTYLCIPSCPPGFIDSKDFCIKRHKVPLPNPVVFNFNDLYE